MTGPNAIYISQVSTFPFQSLSAHSHNRRSGGKTTRERPELKFRTTSSRTRCTQPMLPTRGRSTSQDCQVGVLKLHATDKNPFLEITPRSDNIAGHRSRATSQPGCHCIAALPFNRAGRYRALINNTTATKRTVEYRRRSRAKWATDYRVVFHTALTAESSTEPSYPSTITTAHSDAATKKLALKPVSFSHSTSLPCPHINRSD